jgi:hypothetical protein
MSRALPCVLLVLAAIGCSGDGGGAGGSAITSADLALMVLPKTAFAEEYADLEVDSDSGPADNAAEAENTIDPEDDEADLERAGRLRGYELAYSSRGLTALETGEGAVELATSVELFEDDEAASVYIEDRLADYERFVGRDLDGVTFIDATRFDVGEVGDEAYGMVGEASFAQMRLVGTFVVFRLGRFVGAVVISRADDREVNAEAERLARELESRIEGVLAGDITGAPVPIPEDEEQAASQSEPPAGAPDISGLALHLEDVPEGFSIAKEGYPEETRAIVAFEREFATSGTVLGSSKLVALTSGVELFEAESAADLILELIAQAFTSERGRREFARNFAEGAGFEATSIDIRELRSQRDVKVFHATFDTPVGTFEAVFLYARVGAAVGTVLAMGAEADFDTEDALGLLEPMRRRLASEPG